MINAGVRLVAVIVCILTAISQVYAGKVQDYENILIDNCSVRLQPGRNIAEYAVPYMYASDFTSAELPAGAQETLYVTGAHFPENAIDGDLNTMAVMGNRWDWTLVLDLQKESLVNRISVTFDIASYPLNYDILITTEEKPSIDADGSAALRAWADNAELIINESENRRGGEHEFNFKPVKARYIILRDNIAQPNVRQMGIAEIEVNETADFYLSDTLEALYSLKTGNIRRVVNADISEGLLISALYGKNGGIVGDIVFENINKSYPTADILVEKMTEYTDYSKSALQDIYFAPSPVSGSRYNPEYYTLADSKGMRYVPSLGYYGKRIYVQYPEFAVDDSKLTFACASKHGCSLCLELESEKQVSAAKITFADDGIPKNFEVVAVDSSGVTETVACVTDNNRKNSFFFKFEPVTAKKICVYEKEGSRMSISDIHIYDRAPEYELRSFVFDGPGTLSPQEDVKTLD